MQPRGGAKVANITSFAVHRQLVKVFSVELAKTFYTSGDPVSPVISVKNVSNRVLDNLQVEFEAYTYPWIAPAPDETPTWKTVIAGDLSLKPGEEKTYHFAKAAVVQAEIEIWRSRPSIYCPCECFSTPTVSLPLSLLASQRLT